MYWPGGSFPPLVPGDGKVDPLEGALVAPDEWPGDGGALGREPAMNAAGERPGELLSGRVKAVTAAAVTAKVAASAPTV